MKDRSERLNYEEVASICDMFKARDITPTINKIYVITGKGSNSTINKFLEKWNIEEKSRVSQLNPSIIRSIEAEIEKETYKLISSINNNLKVAENDIEDLRFNLSNANRLIDERTNKIKINEKNHQKEIEKLNNQINAETLEKKLLNERLSKLEKENRDGIIIKTTCESENKQLKQSLEKTEQSLEKTRKEKDEILIELGRLRSIVEGLKNNLN